MVSALILGGAVVILVLWQMLDASRAARCKARFPTAATISVLSFATNDDFSVEMSQLEQESARRRTGVRQEEGTREGGGEFVRQ